MKYIKTQKGQILTRQQKEAIKAMRKQRQGGARGKDWVNRALTA